MEKIYDLVHQGLSRTADKTAEEAKHDAYTLGQELDELRRKTDALTIACQALGELLRDATGMTDAAVFEKMREVDLRDGKLDGKMGAQPIPCAHCGRTTNDHRKACLFCGKPLTGGDILKRSKALQPTRPRLDVSHDP